jgi:hypothetical protein
LGAFFVTVDHGQMLKTTYKHFNERHFSPEKYRRVLAEIFTEAGDTCLRMCETPVFISRSFSDEVVRGATEIIRQSLAPELRHKLDRAVLPGFNIQPAPGHPAFFIIDFAVARDNAGRMVPRLIEMQAFASNLVFTPLAARIYKKIYGLDERYQYLLSAAPSLKETILGGHAPENVILMEMNGRERPSRQDFVATQKWLGIPIVDVTDVIKSGSRLFYRNTEGKLVRIRRIYNGVIPAEFQSLRLAEKTQFKFTDKLDVEWVSDPFWCYRVSKCTMPYLDHPMVPETRFLDQVADEPPDLENYVLKPVFLNAGLGVKLNITKADLDAVPVHERRNYILMRKVAFAPFIPDLKGNMRNAEIRVMFVWPDKLEPVAMSARVMRGNDTNESLQGDAAWCGMAPVLIVEE